MTSIIKRIIKSRRHLARIILLTLASAFVVFHVALHVVSFLFSRHDRDMKQFRARSLQDEFGYTLRYYELKQAGAKWRIIFIHGTPASAAIFGEQFKRPFPRADLLAFDRPGFAGSTPSKRHPSIDDQANAVSAFLAQSPPRSTIIVGHSYGAPVTLAAAIRFSNQVAGVLLIGGSVDPAQERTYMAQRVADWPIFSWLLPPLLRQCNRELLTPRGDLVQLQPKLGGINCPVVMLHGGCDRQVPVENVDYLRRQLAAAGKTNLFQSLVVPEFNHFIPWEHPESVEDALHLITDGH